MKKLRSILCLTMCLALITGLCAGCGDKEEAVSDGLLEVKMFADVSMTEDAVNTAILEMIEEKFDIKLEIESPPSTSYKERMQIMLASGDYPDLILFKDNGTEFIDAVESGILLPLNDYLEDKENLNNYSYEQSWEATQVLQDGDIYAIPRSTMMRQDGFYIRADWLRNLGMEVPEDRKLTLDELYEILYRFTYDDPDGNGKNDTYGIASYNDSTKGMTMTIEETFNLFGWQKAKSGKYKYMDPKYSQTDDSYKKALEFNAKLFKEKLIDPDAPTITTYVNSTDRFKRGITGVIRAFPAYVDDYIDEMRKIDPDADICMVTGIENEAGSTKVGTPYSTGYFGLWGISTGCKDPERVVKMLDWLISDEQWTTTMYGVEGISWDMQDGERVFKPDAKYGFTRSMMRRNTDSEFYLPKTVDHVDMDLIVTALDECMANAVYSLDRAYSPDIATDPLFIDQQTEMAKVITKILIGEEPVSSYDKALKNWYKNGGTEYVEDMNKYIEKIEKQTK